MSSELATTAEDGSYSEILGEYLTVVADIAQLLDDFGRPDPDRFEEYSRLRRRKDELRTALRAKRSGHDEPTDVETMLDEAFSDR